VNLLIATHNAGKKREFAQLLDGLDLNMLTLDDMHISFSIPETGETYAANAMSKALGYAALAGTLTLADDSGLEVDALHGEPGIHSARYGGTISDTQRCELLLKRMVGIPQSQRTARFRCVIALAWPDGESTYVEGVCEGLITTEMRGKGGFGYDPVFWIEKEGMTMAELPAESKNLISHRAMAIVNARELLENCIKMATP
jgi:XTP/dITP diphosphohydrolase